MSRQIEFRDALNEAMSEEMRRDEKDFLARLDPAYVESVEATGKQFATALAQAGSIQDEKKQQLGKLMDSYLANFKTLADAVLEGS